MSFTLACVRCSTVFEAKNTLTQYCPRCKVERSQERSRGYETGAKEPCPACGKPMVRRANLCRTCENKTRIERYKGSQNPHWRQGRSHSHGYVYIRVKEGTPGKNKGAFYRGEHVLNWEHANNKPLPKGWVVHHLNGVKDDNRVPNLAAMPRQYHHSHPRETLRVYERRIRELEKELLAVQQAELEF